MEIGRTPDALGPSVTDARGASLAELVGAFLAPDPERARDPQCLSGLRTEVTAALDDSGTGWRQLFAVVRCERCGRSTAWHYDD